MSWDTRDVEESFNLFWQSLNGLNEKVSYSYNLVRKICHNRLYYTRKKKIGVDFYARA